MVSPYWPNKYQGTQEPYVPIVRFPRAPASPLTASTDFRNPHTGKNYAIGQEWSDESTNDIYKLVDIASNLGVWVLISSGGGTSALIDIAVPLGTSPVYPDAAGEMTFTSTGGSIDITGSANAINFDNPGGGAAVESFILPNGTTPVVPDGSGQITLTEGTAITLTGGTNAYTIANTYQPVGSFTVPAGTSPVVPDASGVIAITAGTGVTVTGGLNTYEIALTGDGVAIDAIAVDSTSGTGTDPVLPDGSGIVTMTGAQVAAGVVGANVINVESTAANTITHQIQQADSAAAKDTTKNGVAHFDSAIFSDDEGFISLVSTFYATGTWTPVLSFGGGSTGITYTIQEGQYTRIGNIVYFHYRVELSSKGSSTGGAVISGLPYTAGSTLGGYGNTGSMAGGNFPGTATTFQNSVIISTTTIQLKGTTPLTNTQLVDTNFADVMSFGCLGFYWV